MRSNRSSLLYGKTVGIAGLGVIGQALAALCKAHGMTVVGISDAVRDAVGVDRYFVRAAVLDAVAELDFLVLALPLTSETEGMINAEVFRRMKSTAFLINVARGAIVDEDALVEAVAAGAIAGAGLDTFTIEPLPADSPLWDPDRVFITPHVGGRSDIYAQQIYPIVEHNLRAFLSGSVDEMINVVAR
jgi:phosphoglycerate dehydrogenase-like enzyme